MKINNSELSRVISHALRHEPWIYELELDDGGWVIVDSLVKSLRQMRPEWSNLSASNIENMIIGSKTRRHEIYNKKIRALYGHTIPGKLKRSPAEPPALLYHGTSPMAASEILSEGIKPMDRQFVHSSPDIETATQVGKRKSSNPVILKILATQAFQCGITFYEGNEKVWLSDQIPPEFLITS